MADQAADPKKMMLLTELKKPNKEVSNDWALKVLKVLQPEHAAFQPGFVRPKRKTDKDLKDKDAALYQAYAGILKNLPMPKQDGKKKASTVAGHLTRSKRPSKSQLMQQEMLDLKEQIQMM